MRRESFILAGVEPRRAPDPITITRPGETPKPARRSFRQLAQQLMGGDP